MSPAVMCFKNVSQAMLSSGINYKGQKQAIKLKTILQRIFRAHTLRRRQQFGKTSNAWRNSTSVSEGGYSFQDVSVLALRKSPVTWRKQLVRDIVKNVYSYFEKGCRKRCARDNPERSYGIWSILCSWLSSCRTYFCCFPLALANICP